MKSNEEFLETLKNNPYGIVIERGGIVRKIRKLIYRMGFHPKLGSIFFSPSMAMFYMYKDAMKKAEEK